MRMVVPVIRERPGPQGGYCPVCGRLCLYLPDGRRLEAHFDMSEARFDRPCPGTETRMR